MCHTSCIWMSHVMHTNWVMSHTRGGWAWGEGWKVVGGVRGWLSATSAGSAQLDFSQEGKKNSCHLATNHSITKERRGKEKRGGKRKKEKNNGCLRLPIGMCGVGCYMCHDSFMCAMTQSRVVFVHYFGCVVHDLLYHVLWSLLQNVVSFIGLFCNRDLSF